MASMQTARSSKFTADRVPLRNNDSMQPIQSKIRGPFAFLNPTQAHYEHRLNTSSNYNRLQTTGTPTSASGPVDSTQLSAQNIEYKWTSRDNRKGRHALVTKSPSVQHPEANISTPPKSTAWTSILHTTWLMITSYPVWDISWCVAYIFVIGSVLWVINSFFVFLPFIRPSSTFHNEILVGGGVTAFIGATIFEVGSILLMLEAVNENREGCFGYAVEAVYEEYAAKAETGKGSNLRIVPKDHACTHHHRNKKNLVGKPNSALSHTTTLASNTDKQEQSTEANSWVWFPSWTELKTHYLHELGFLASLSQLFGATIFWISGFTALPGVLNVLSPGLTDAIYWTPQILGGSGFIVSGSLFMIETQKHWWLPAPTVLGWHIGLWNLIGGLGYVL
jgi:hypothetical protein